MAHDTVLPKVIERSEELPKAFKTYPSVYAVADRYVIIVPVAFETVMWVKVGNEEYFDHSNGILRSRSHIHKMEVPAAELDAAGEYTVCYREIYERLPYFTKAGEVETFSVKFRKVPTDRDVNIYHISDAHNYVYGPAMAALNCGAELDALILNGDIPNHSGELENMDNIHEIASHVTKGEIPVIFSRGNHDTRGIYAENIADCTATDNGRSYFTFRLGSIWGVVIDCAEDKPDDSDEYGHTICCSSFRRDETRFLENVIKNADKEYLAPDVTHRIIVSHASFNLTFRPPFDIEQELYKYWVELANENIKPHAMICGHVHSYGVIRPDDERNVKGANFTTVIAVNSQGNKRDTEYGGGLFTFRKDGGISFKFTNVNGEITHEEDI